MPLGFERLKICELFAELLHCSNMAHLNKPVNKSQQSKTEYISTFENSKAATEEEEEEQTTASSPDKIDDSSSKDDVAADANQEPKPETVENVENDVNDDVKDEVYVADRLKLQFIEHKVLPTCLVRISCCLQRKLYVLIIFDILANAGHILWLSIQQFLTLCRV